MSEGDGADVGVEGDLGEPTVRTGGENRVFAFPVSVLAGHPREVVPSFVAWVGDLVGGVVAPHPVSESEWISWIVVLGPGHLARLDESEDSFELLHGEHAQREEDDRGRQKLPDGRSVEEHADGD